MGPEGIILPHILAGGVGGAGGVHPAGFQRGAQGRVFRFGGGAGGGQLPQARGQFFPQAGQLAAEGILPRRAKRPGPRQHHGAQGTGIKHRLPFFTVQRQHHRKDAAADRQQHQPPPPGPKIAAQPPQTCFHTVPPTL